MVPKKICGYLYYFFVSQRRRTSADFRVRLLAQQQIISANWPNNACSWLVSLTLQLNCVTWLQGQAFYCLLAMYIIEKFDKAIVMRAFPLSPGFYLLLLIPNKTPKESPWCIKTRVNTRVCVWNLRFVVIDFSKFQRWCARAKNAARGEPHPMVEITYQPTPLINITPNRKY